MTRLLLPPQTMLASMVDAAEGLCPHAMKRSGLRQELLKAGAARMSVPRSFVTTTLLEQSGVDIINKIRSGWPRGFVGSNVFSRCSKRTGPALSRVTAADVGYQGDEYLSFPRYLSCASIGTDFLSSPYQI